jgi:rubredoxin
MNNLKKLFKVVNREIKIGDAVQKVKMYQCKKGCGYQSAKPDPEKDFCPGCAYQDKVEKQRAAEGTLRTKSGAPKRKGGNFREVNRDD